jgi:hypothetical protein
MALARSLDKYTAIGVTSSEFVRNKSAWMTLRARNDGVLSRLSADALDEFEQSMRFSQRNGLLRSANCTKIASELGDKISEFFKIFGADPTILGMFYPFKCNEGNGNCDPFPGFYCNKYNTDPCTID